MDVHALVRLGAGEVLRRRESVDDLAQSICREILMDLPAFRGCEIAQFKKWVATLALHKLQDRYRFWTAERRDVRRDQAVAVGESSVGADPLLRRYASFCTPSRDAAAREEVDRIEDAFGRLPAEYAQVIALACVAEWSHKEIADEMGRSEGAVRMLLSRARARLALLMVAE